MTGAGEARHVLWVDGIKLATHARCQLEVYRRRQRQITFERLALEQIPKEIMDTGDPYFRWRETEARAFVCHDLSKGDPLLYPIELLRPLLKDLPLTDRHTIFRLGDERPLYVPAFLLIRALFTATRSLTEQLFVPGAADLFGHAVNASDGLHVHIAKRLRMGALTQAFARLLAWLLANPDAQRAHASVLTYAREGRLCMDLPRLDFSGWARGPTLGNGILVTDLFSLEFRFPMPRTAFRVSAGKQNLVLTST